MNTNFLLKALAVVAIFFGAYYFTKGPSFPNSFIVENISGRIKFGDHQDFSGATLVNLDEDSALEIFISSHGSKNLFLKLIGNEFVPFEIGELADAEGLTYSVTACDLDKDGRDELLVLNKPESIKEASHSRILKFKNGVWIDLIQKNDSLVAQLGQGYSSTCIDRKGDGQYGFVVSNSNGEHLYLELVDSKVSEVSDRIGLVGKSKGRSILGVPGPTGHTNIFIGNEDGPNFYFKNKGDGTFVEVASELGISDPKFNARGASLIDLNNDDMPDIVYGNHLGPTRLLQQSRDGKFKDVTPEDIIQSYAVNAAVVSDFNLDGYEDIYLNNIRGDNKLFAHFENNWFELGIEALEEKEMFGISTIAGDLDKNGSFEIMNTHGDGGQFPLTLYTVKPVNNWIKFSVTSKTGAIPRGSIVKLRTSARDLVRVIHSGSGRFANYDYVITFGLLKNEVPLVLDVTLPSGKKMSFEKKYKLFETYDISVEY